MGALASAVGDHRIVIGNAIGSATRKKELKNHEKAIAEIYSKYPKLRAAFEPDAARDAMYEVKEGNSIPKLHHTILKAKGSQYKVVDVNADGSVDEGYGERPADSAWGFIRGCNRVFRASDGWEHYWKEHE
jgi:hypothetical protein